MIDHVLCYGSSAQVSVYWKVLSKLNHWVNWKWKILILGQHNWYSECTLGWKTKESRFDSLLWCEISLFATASRLDLRLTKCPTHYVVGCTFPKATAVGVKANHPPPTSAKVKNPKELYLHSHICLTGMQTDNFFTNYFYNIKCWLI